MEPILKPLRDMGKKVGGLSGSARGFLFAGIALAIAVVVIGGVLNSGATYQYVFTNLSTEDSGEAATQLKSAGIPFRVEAGGAAISVPSSQVYDARLLLASSGLPRGGGVGFEIFDRGDLGVSEFTQKVNLRRALEGELGRTVGRLAAVKSARVHLTLQEKGLYRDDDRRASAAVVVNLQPGRSLNDREISGVRHLVSSAVPGLNSEAVTVMDGRGAVLAGEESASTKLSSAERSMEGNLEARVMSLLEAAVGPGAVVAKVSATLDTSEVETTQDSFDPESATVRSERRVNETSNQDSSSPSGLAGAAANQPMAAAGSGSAGGRGAFQREDELKNYEISKTVTRSVTRTPRLKRLSVAVLVDGIDGKPREAPELARLTELAKGAVGFDASRGDKIEVSSAPFQHAKGADGEGPVGLFDKPLVKYGAMGGAALVGLLILFALFKVASGGKNRSSAMADSRLLLPGARVADVEAALAQVEAQMGRLPAASSSGEAPALADPALGVRDRARALASGDPVRAAMLLKAWIEADKDKRAKEAA